ncbi:MAG: hypothetical protein ABEI52_06925 [Halobacteriaceae archaeon]
MAEQQSPTKIGEPQKDDTIEEACYGCGVVQEMAIYVQRYEDHPPSHFPKGECPVCGNDHSSNPPW